LRLPTQRPIQRAVLANVEASDRALFTLDMTWPFRPGELFALRRRNFNYEERKLAVTQTAYKGKLREWGKTPRALNLAMSSVQSGLSVGSPPASVTRRQPSAASSSARGESPNR
jgi:integrase